MTNAALEHVEMMERLLSSNGQKINRFQWLLEHGMPFDGPRRRVKRMRARACYSNAFHLAAFDYNLVYVEGVAVDLELGFPTRNGPERSVSIPRSIMYSTIGKIIGRCCVANMGRRRCGGMNLLR